MSHLSYSESCFWHVSSVPFKVYLCSCDTTFQVSVSDFLMFDALGAQSVLFFKKTPSLLDYATSSSLLKATTTLVSEP